MTFIKHVRLTKELKCKPSKNNKTFAYGSAVYDVYVYDSKDGKTYKKPQYIDFTAFGDAAEFLITNSDKKHFKVVGDNLYTGTPFNNKGETVVNLHMTFSTVTFPDNPPSVANNQTARPDNQSSPQQNQQRTPQGQQGHPQGQNQQQGHPQGQNQQQPQQGGNQGYNQQQNTMQPSRPQNGYNGGQYSNSPQQNQPNPGAFNEMNDDPFASPHDDPFATPRNNGF